MSNLTTRKTVLRMLMVLVLAFSVQGIADALTFGTTRTGDFQIVLPGDDFDITFRPDLEGSVDVNDFFTPARPRHRKASATDIEYADGTRTRPGNPDPITSSFSVTVDAGYTAGDTHYYIVTTTSTVRNTADTADVTRTLHTRNWTTEAEAYYYNAEQVTISVTGGATLKKVGRYDAPSSPYILAETGEDGSKLLDSTMTLTFTAPSSGAEQTITISDSTTVADDYPTGVTAARSLTFTVYVVNFDSNTSSAVTLTGGTQIAEKLYAGDRSSQRAQPIFAGNTDNLPLVFRVEGGGQVYAREPARATDANREGPRSSGNREFVLSSSATVYLDMKGKTNTVRVHPRGTNPNNTGRTYIYVNNYANLTITHGDRQTGAPGGRLEEYLGVQVTDSGGNRVPGIVVRFPNTGTDSNGDFIPFPGTTVYVNAANALVSSATDATKEFIAEPSKHVTGADAMMVKTDSNGEAKVYYAFNSDATVGDKTISPGLMHASTVRADFTATVATEGNTRTANLEIVSGNPQSATKGKNLDSPLVVIARSTGGHRIPNVIIQFRSVAGILTPAPGTMQPDDSAIGGANNPSSGQQIYVITGANGEAGVTYNVGQTVVARDIIAEVRFEAGATQYDFAIDRVVFNVNGRTGTGGGTTTPPPTTTRTITLTLSSTTGEPGDEIDVTVTTSAATPDFVVIDSDDFSDADFGDLTGLTPHETTLTLPDEEGEYSFFAVGPGGVTSNEVTVTVEVGILGEISITQIGTPSNGAQTFSISVVDTAGDRISGALTVLLSGAGFTTRNVETLNGIGNARLTLPTAEGLYTLTASADDYTSGTTQVRIAGTATTPDTTTPTTPTTTTTTPTTTVSAPDSVSIVGSSQREGTANQALDAALIVQVVDEDGDPVEGVRVIFRRRTGQGRLSDRGSGGAIIDNTDEDGYARATYTPISARSTVEVEAKGVTRRVTFTITASGGTTTPTPRDTDTATTPTPGAISPVVHVGAAQRPPMLWVDGGAIYALVGASAERFAPGVDNALNIAIGGGKIYWTEKTGDSAGTINSANLNGSNVQELASILAVPMGIAVDAVNSTLYWTNSRGRIQTANLDGSGITNVIPGGLEGVMDLALAGGNAYWTQGGNVRFVNLRGQKQIRNISTGTDTAGSLAIGGGKVYWTEMTGESGGTVNSANLNGTGATELATILAAPSGIAVDGSRSKLYWGNARGRIQTANLDGSKISNVVSGLESPGDMVLSNSIAAPTATPTTTTTTARSKYDVNGDGKVDNTDAGLVSDAMANGSSNAKYDVNGDGTVNFLDLLLVFDNRDADAAAAPTLLGMQMTAAQVDILQEQINLLIATGDRSPAAMRTLIYLQQLIATARPEKTQLLANYPNPFNPETWIPYELATDTTVKITIYNTQGVVIRTLALGHQSAGYYTGRDRAAYWDGRNALGEQVASGIYFYQLETDTLSLMRKMVILK